METKFWLIFSLLAIATVLACVVVWFLHGILTELRNAHEQRANLMGQVIATLQEVRTTFLEADGSFKHLIDTLQGIGNLQQIKERVNQISADLIDEHHKISSQIGTSGRVIDLLHKLISQWSEQGSDLQRAYQVLANAIREEILREASQREKLSVQLETLIQRTSIGKAVDASK